MSTVKIILQVEIDNSSGWLGLEDYKKHEGANSDLEALKKMTELEGCSPPLNMLINLTDDSANSKFIAVDEVEKEIC